MDHQWIHIDVERASEGPFGAPIAHGHLTLSIMGHLPRAAEAANAPRIEGQKMGINYGFNKLRFLKPVVAGSRLRGRFVLKSVTQRNATDLLRENLLTIEIEGDETPALVADWLGLAVFEAS